MSNLWLKILVQVDLAGITVAYACVMADRCHSYCEKTRVDFWNFTPDLHEFSVGFTALSKASKSIQISFQQHQSNAEEIARTKNHTINELNSLETMELCDGKFFSRRVAIVGYGNLPEITPRPTHELPQPRGWITRSDRTTISNLLSIQIIKESIVY
jgi:hypothetical protein